jgi:hypothetical protein
VSTRILAPQRASFAAKRIARAVAWLVTLLVAAPAGAVALWAPVGISVPASLTKSERRAVLATACSAGAERVAILLSADRDPDDRAKPIQAQVMCHADAGAAASSAARLVRCDLTGKTWQCDPRFDSYLQLRSHGVVVFVYAYDTALEQLRGGQFAPGLQRDLRGFETLLDMAAPAQRRWMNGKVCHVQSWVVHEEWMISCRQEATVTRPYRQRNFHVARSCAVDRIPIGSEVCHNAIHGPLVTSRSPQLR